MIINTEFRWVNSEVLTPGKVDKKAIQSNSTYTSLSRHLMLITSNLAKLLILKFLGK